MAIEIKQSEKIEHGKTLRQVVMWQENTDGECLIAEPAIVINNYYGGIISINQENKEIILNIATVNAVIHELKIMKNIYENNK